MFSFQTLHLLCELRKFLPKYFSNSSLGSEKVESEPTFVD